MVHSPAGTLVEALGLDAPPQPRVHVEAVDNHVMPVQCHHCEDAPCLAICPSGAIHRPVEDGPVLIDPDQCIGCKFCVLACPFGVIELSRDGRAVVKCDQCVQRTAEGRQPACVAGCPTGALQFVGLDEYTRRRRREAVRRLAQERK
jgi:carbon-monoxide dehydrogenase iron sulfur subunit